MLKKITKFCLVLFSVCGLAGCTDDSPSMYTVTFYDDEAVLATQDVIEGEKATEYTPDKDGYIFDGWYSTPTLTHEFDFDTPINEDTSVFASFHNYVEDTRDWYIVGSGTSPVLAASEWGKLIDSTTQLTKSDEKNVNKFSITLDLFADDQFQFVINDAWNNQRGGGYLTTTKLDDTAYFEVAGSVYSDETKKSNITCLIDGNYTLTLTTYPGQDYYDTEDSNYTEENKENFNFSNLDTITWVRNGDATKVEPDTSVYDVYIKGTMTDWNITNKTTTVKGIAEMTYTFASNDEFGFAYYDEGSTEGYGTWLGLANLGTSGDANSLFTGTNNLVCSTAGDYKITIDVYNKVINFNTVTVD